ncbi:MAG: putative glycosyl hydrolase family 15 [Gaiellales bacterium]|nr:putative glycosyl hydrolase family 15 [Gaiellales bacterium]
MYRRLLVATVISTGLIAAPAAQADVLDQLYAPLHVHPPLAPSPSFIKSHFPTISIHDAMRKKGYTAANVGYYTKGTRSAKSTYPDSFYLRTAAGKRIKDRARSNYFVMNPASSGWRKEVAKACSKVPDWCFVDAMGDDGYTRVTAKPKMSKAQWTRALLDMASYLEKAGSYRVVANNLISAKGDKIAVGYEMFARVPAERSLQVLKNTVCFCFVKLGTTERARYGFSLFLSGANSADRVSVGTDHQPGKWWPFFKKGAQLGKALGEATVKGDLITRQFEHGTVVVNAGSSEKRLALGAGRQPVGGAAALKVGARDGAIILR